MGNSSSSQRAESSRRAGRRFHEFDRQRSARSRSPALETGRSSRLARSRTSSPRPTQQQQPQQRDGIYGTIRRQLSTHSIRASADGGQIPSDETAFEQEERPLVNMDELQDTQITRIVTEPLMRRQSTMSRLGSRLLPDTVLRGLLNSGEETAAEGRALRHGYTGRTSPTVWERQVPTRNSRFSLRETLRQRASTRSETTRRPIRGPFPLGHTEHQVLQNDGAREEPGILNEGTTESPQNRSPWRRHARLSRVRNSLTAPLQHIFARDQDRSQPTHARRGSPSRPSRVTFADDGDHLLPPLSGIDHRLDVDDTPHELDAVEPETRNVLSSSRITQGMSTIRRFPHGLRSRSTRLIRRGEHPPLSQVLQLAAAAIAAQLSGHAGPGTNGVRSLGGDTFDGSIQNFVQTLQDAASAQAGENIDLNAADGDLPPVNFMRVFQFPNDENGAPITHQGQSQNADSMEIDNPDGDRSVTLVLVGVRSMPHGQEGAGNEHGTIGPSLDTLLSLPFLPPTNVLRNGSSGALFRRSDGRTRPNNRRHSMTNFNFPAQYESQRHQRTRGALRPASEESALPESLGSPFPTMLSESPPGPNPPPPTPADMRSGNATPIRRPSSASAVHAPPLPDLSESQESASTLTPAESSFNTARQRRRSDSEFARRPELGSGAARRNGVVEPDNPPASPGRSWLIYVVGTNVSSDHPAFTMPSLFTDNPSYEDMQMLSTLLGPVKPPVATQDDVATAGGVFRLVLRGGDLTAEAVAGQEVPSLILEKGDRCLICLCDYEISEEIRQLNKCQHVYHRECIDEWLLTGRNACPLCRRQGVGEQSNSMDAAVAPAADVEAS